MVTWDVAEKLLKIRLLPFSNFSSMWLLNLQTGHVVVSSRGVCRPMLPRMGHGCRSRYAITLFVDQSQVVLMRRQVGRFLQLCYGYP